MLTFAATTSHPSREFEANVHTTPEVGLVLRWCKTALSPDCLIPHNAPRVKTDPKRPYAEDLCVCAVMGWMGFHLDSIGREAGGQVW